MSDLDVVCEDYWQYLIRHYPERAILSNAAADVTWWPSAQLETQGQRGELDKIARAFANALRPGPPNGVAATDARALQWELETEIARCEFPFGGMLINHMSGPHLALTHAAEDTVIGTGQSVAAYLERLHCFQAFVRDSVESREEARAMGVWVPQASEAVVVRQIDQMLADPVSLGSRLSGPLRQYAEIVYDDVVRAGQIIAREVMPALTLLRDAVSSDLACSSVRSPLNSFKTGERWYEFCVREQSSFELTASELVRAGSTALGRLSAEAQEIAGRSGSIGDLLIEMAQEGGGAQFGSAEEMLAAFRSTCRKIDRTLDRVTDRLPLSEYIVEPMPEALASGGPAAYYGPCSLSAGRPGRFWINVLEWERRRRWDLVPLCIHESVPGHHLQIAIADEADWLPRFRRFAEWNGFTEGWAVYAERLAFELGVSDAALDRLGGIAHQMWRAARLVVDSGIHQDGWTVEEAADFLSTASGLPHEEAYAECVRYACWPGQATGYWLGAESFQNAAISAARAGYSLREFHAQVLRQGPVPPCQLGTVE